MKQFYGIFILILFLTAAHCQAQDFKVVGYLPYYRFQLIDDIPYQKLTHLNLAFANPDSEGNLDIGGKNIDPIVTRAHQENVEVFLSLAGGALTSAWASAWKELIKPSNRSAYIHKIINYTLAHQLDGLDVDLEWSHVDDNYSGFVIELKDSLHIYGLPMTAALPGTYKYPQISNAALAAYDWINMMVYDLRGPWDPSNAGPHSPMSFAVNSINYWVGKGMPKARLTLGMPFYGYDFSNPNQVRALTYAQIVNLDPANAYSDQAGEIYYNGIPTIEDKTQLAIDELAGAMVWELGQDKFDQYSLLTKIDEVVQSNISGTNLVGKNSFVLFPNPFHSELTVQFNNPATGTLTLFDLHGNALVQQKMNQQTSISFTAKELSSGMYTAQFKSDNRLINRKIVKR